MTPQWIPDSWACRLYLLTVLVETAIDLAIEGDLILRFHESSLADDQDMATRRMPVYLSIFALAQYVLSPLLEYLDNELRTACSNSSWLWMPYGLVTSSSSSASRECLLMFVPFSLH